MKTEYSTELRNTTQLADLVPRIAPNIDSLLTRYNSGSDAAAVNMMYNKQQAVNSDVVIGEVNDVGRIASASKQNPVNTRYQDNTGIATRHKQRKGTAQNSSPFCPGCFYLSKQLKATIHFKHTPGDCPRKTLTVKMFQVEDSEHFDQTSHSSGKEYT